MRGIGEIGFNQALKFDQGLVIKHHIINLAHVDASFLQAIGNGSSRKSSIMFFACETLFLGSGNNAAIDDKRCCAVMIISRNPEDCSQVVMEVVIDLMIDCPQNAAVNQAER